MTNTGNFPSADELFRADLVARAARAMEGTPFEAAQRAILFDYLSTILLSAHNARLVMEVLDRGPVTVSGVVRRMLADV